MQYTSSGIVCLANDLRAHAEALQNKRIASGDLKKKINQVEQISSHITFYPQTPGWQWYKKSRLVIVGHGDDGSRCITVDSVRWDPAELARHVASWLNNQTIGRISLHMCFGGGNRGNATGDRFEAFEVRPSQSFAYKFASCCSLATSITARTDTMSMQVHTKPQPGTSVPKFITAHRDVGYRLKGLGDKIVFGPNGGTIDKPVNPDYSWDG